MRRHLGIGSIDLGFAHAGLDDGELGVVGNGETRHASNGGQSAGVGTDPVAEPLGPGRLDLGEVRGAPSVVVAMTLG
jgi:hypothetical protein